MKSIASSHVEYRGAAKTGGRHSGERAVLNARRQGFTLIELLIVVAIIAILAAIAVPNFLEAQVRSKVSRAQADLRSIATAVESYRVDYNGYPPAELYTNLAERLVRITTPIAYITLVPEDPFYELYDPSTHFAGDSHKYCYAPGNIYSAAPPSVNAKYANRVYSLASRGPDRHFNFGGLCMLHPYAVASNAYARGSYDPTNGSTSEGDVIRLGSGAP